MQSNLKRKMNLSLLLVLLLSLSLAVTSLALALSIAKIEDNIFFTGIVDINLNDGQPVVNVVGAAPGTTIEKTFWLKNESTTSVFCRVYGTQIKGELAEELDVKLYTLELDASGSETSRELVFQGKLCRMVKENMPRLDEPIGIGVTRYFAIELYFPEDCGNAFEDSDADFNLEAMAVQAKNNPNGSFS